MRNFWESSLRNREAGPQQAAAPRRTRGSGGPLDTDLRARTAEPPPPPPGAPKAPPEKWERQGLESACREAGGPARAAGASQEVAPQPRDCHHAGFAYLPDPGPRVPVVRPAAPGLLRPVAVGKGCALREKLFFPPGGLGAARAWPAPSLRRASAAAAQCAGPRLATYPLLHCPARPRLREARPRPRPPAS